MRPVVRQLSTSLGQQVGRSSFMASDIIVSHKRNGVDSTRKKNYGLLHRTYTVYQYYLLWYTMVYNMAVCDLSFLERLGRWFLSLLGTHKRVSFRRQSVNTVHSTFIGALVQRLRRQTVTLATGVQLSYAPPFEYYGRVVRLLKGTQSLMQSRGN